MTILYDVCLLSLTAIKGWKSQHLFILRVLSPSWPYQALNLCKLVEWTNFRALSLILKACDFGKHHTHLRKQTPSKIGAKSALMGFNPTDYPARALRALGLLLADGAPTVGGGKTF